MSNKYALKKSNRHFVAVSTTSFRDYSMRKVSQYAGRAIDHNNEYNAIDLGNDLYSIQVSDSNMVMYCVFQRNLHPLTDAQITNVTRWFADFIHAPIFVEKMRSVGYGER